MGPDTIRYSVQGGSPRIDATFEVVRDGTVVVQLLTQASVPQGRPVRLGTFSGTLPPAFLADVEAAVPPALAAARAAAAGPQAPPGPVTRVLSLGDEEPQLVDPFSLPAGFEQGLAAAGVEALSNPVAAVEVGADLPAGVLGIRSLGPRPFPILLYDDSQPGYFARVWRGEGEDVVGLDLAAVQALVHAGRIPAGEASVAAGETLYLPLPPPVEGDPDPLTGNFAFWRTGGAYERRIVAGTW